MLKNLRQNIFLNRLVRWGIKSFGETSSRLYEFASSRWPASGAVGLNFNGINFKLLSNCDDHLADCFFYEERYAEENDLKFFLELVKHSKIIVDIGANTGLYSILSALNHPGAKIIAFEPFRSNSDRLQKNCDINLIENVTICGKALGDKKSIIHFTVPKNNRIIDVSSANEEFSKKFYSDEIEWTNVEVEQTTLDEFVASNLRGEKVDLIKIDVESYEMNVFSGMEFVLSHYQPNILFETFLDNERKNFFNRIIDRYNYNAYIFLRDGVLRLDEGFQENYDGLNFFISKNKSSKAYTSYGEMHSLVSELTRN